MEVKAPMFAFDFQEGNVRNLRKEIYQLELLKDIRSHQNLPVTERLVLAFMVKYQCLYCIPTTMI